LTGGIASGKSTVGALLRELGAPVVDADELARKVVEPGKPAFDEVVKAFGPGVVAPDGTLDRKKIGDLVFADPEARKRLNAITHPRIALAAHDDIAAQIAAGEKVVIYEAALLVETGLNNVLDGLIVVSVPADVQLTRLMARDGIDEAAAVARLAAQYPLAKKLAVATEVIDNSGTREATRAQVERLWSKLSS
jgi:dephospho-CoA kinase